MIDRRDFLRLAAGFAVAARATSLPAAPKPVAAKLDLLIVGTAFLGLRIAEAARQRGHEATLVDRVTRSERLSLHDEHNREFVPAADRRWDGVIDTTAMLPADVRRLARLVGAQTQYYLLVSGTSVYARLEKPGIDETAPLQRTQEPDAERATDQNAAALLALCEKEADKALPGRVCVVRAGLLAGPGDPSGRFTYWPVRVARGGDVLAPGTAGDFVQFIDVRDLADFIVLCAERRPLGTFNAAGEPTTMGTLLETCRKVARSNARFVWADAAFLAQHKVRPYRDLPVWVPAAGAYAGFGRISSAKAKAVGLHYRPLAQTVADTLAWARSDVAAQRVQRRAGLAPQREADIVKAWKERRVAAAADGDQADTTAQVRAARLRKANEAAQQERAARPPPRDKDGSGQPR